MEINALKKRIEEILGISLTVSMIGIAEWKSIAYGRSETYPGTFRRDGRFVWLLKEGSAEVQILEAKSDSLTEREAGLVELLLAGTKEQGNKPLIQKRDEEAKSIQLGEWIQSRLEEGDLQRHVPDDFALKPRLAHPMLPLLLTWDNRSAQEVPFSKLYQLLRSYFGGDLLLVPLKESWMILVSEALLADLREQSEEGADSQRELLSALCEGLYELISNEWGGGGYHLAVHEMYVNDGQIAEAAAFLRETLEIGHLFRVTEHIHLPWELRLERLVFSIPEEERQRFFNDVGGHAGVFSDEEMMTTLETFFQMDCNVSETAKRLYIHRNTLLYRIDKIKQETGLEVRTFRDAVLMNLELLLYKVTKRV